MLGKAMVDAVFAWNQFYLNLLELRGFLDYMWSVESANQRYIFGIRRCKTGRGSG